MALKVKQGSAVLVVDEHGRILLQQRDDDIPPAGVGRWAIPGGGREGDESPLETALREFEEETTVRLRSVRHFGHYAPPEDPLPDELTLDVFLSDDTVPRDAITVLEGMDFAYHAIEDLPGLPANPPTRRYLEEIVASPMLAAARERRLLPPSAVCVVELNRWGEALLLRPGDGRPGDWALPFAPVPVGVSPDRAAFDAFEAATGEVLDSMRLWRTVRRDEDPWLPAAQAQVYYFDADLDYHRIPAMPGSEAFRAGPRELETASLAPWTREALARFFASPAYRAMFH